MARLAGRLTLGLIVMSTALLGLARAAAADVLQSYSLAWSGYSFSNTAIASGLITLDLSTLPNPSSSSVDIIGSIESLTLTISGANSGNGTFTLADMRSGSPPYYTFWNTGGSTLNMATQLVGQTVSGGTWGPIGGIGDFNLVFLAPGPTAVAPFTLGTAGGDGDRMALTSFAPVPMPEPGSLALLALGLVGLAGVAQRRRA